MCSKKKRGSEVLGRYLIAPLMIADFESYRQRHWDHHKHLGVEGETKDAYLIDIHGNNLFLLFLRSVLMLEMFKKISKQIQEVQPRRSPRQVTIGPKQPFFFRRFSFRPFFLSLTKAILPGPRPLCMRLSSIPLFTHPG